MPRVSSQQFSFDLVRNASDRGAHLERADHGRFTSWENRKEFPARHAERLNPQYPRYSTKLVSGVANEKNTVYKSD